MSESENKDLPHAFYIMTTEKVFELCSSYVLITSSYVLCLCARVRACVRACVYVCTMRLTNNIIM